MIVSLSASHGNNAKAIAILDECDLIYTTQWFRLEELRLRFPQADIRPIPDSTPSMIEFLRERHQDDKIFTFGDLLYARHSDGDSDSHPDLITGSVEKSASLELDPASVAAFEPSYPDGRAEIERVLR